MSLLSCLQLDARMQLYDGISAPVWQGLVRHLIYYTTQAGILGSCALKVEVSIVVGGRSEEQVSVLQLGFGAVFDAKLPW